MMMIWLASKRHALALVVVILRLLREAHSDVMEELIDLIHSFIH